MSELINRVRRLPIQFLDLEPADGFDELDFVKVVVAGEEAESAWRILRDHVPETQRWPVILGGMDSLETLRENVDFVRDRLLTSPNEPQTLLEQVVKWIQEAEESPFEAWIENHRNPAWLTDDYTRQANELEGFSGTEQLADLYRRFAAEHREREPEQFDPLMCEWPAEETPGVTEISVLQDPSTWDLESDEATKPWDEVVILLLPTAVAWEAPAYLFFGGFNACPPPAVHVAMAKWAYRRNSAEIVAVSGDQIELQCRRPPSSRVDAIRLARDLQLYSESVRPDCETVGELASSLTHGTTWSFWWD